MSCGFRTRAYGSFRDDGACINGVLYDLDSGDEDQEGGDYPYDGGSRGLTSPDNQPCPVCRPEAWLRFVSRVIREDIDAPDRIAAWEKALVRALELDRPGALAGLTALTREWLEADDPGCCKFHRLSPDLHDVLETRSWPWRPAYLTAHEYLSILPRGKAAAEPASAASPSPT